MVAPRDPSSRIKAVVRSLAAKSSLQRLAMIGTPPSQRPLWHDHAARALGISPSGTPNSDSAGCENASGNSGNGHGEASRGCQRRQGWQGWLSRALTLSNNIPLLQNLTS
jgi:hypothetical protein